MTNDLEQRINSLDDDTPQEWVVSEMRPITYMLRDTRYEATSVVTGNVLDIEPDDYYQTGIKHLHNGYRSSVFVHKESPWGEHYKPKETN